MKEVNTRDALLRAAERLLEQEGPDGVTTRAVCAVGKVQAPTLYHHFGDKAGLLDAVVEKGIDAFLTRKRAIAETPDALADLVSGWDDFIDFALDRPRLFQLMVQRSADKPNLLDAAMATTAARLARLDDEGRLQTDVAFGCNALLALSIGVAALPTIGVPKSKVKQIARCLLMATLEVVVRRL